MDKKKKKQRMVRTQIQLTASQADELKRLSAEKGRSMAFLIRDAVDGLLRKSGGADREELKRRARAAAGIGRSGLADVAENHDAYLDEAFDPEKP